MPIAEDCWHQGTPAMSTKRVPATMARGLVLAGLSLVLIWGSGPASGADLAILKKATLRGPGGDRVDLTAPPGGVSVLVFYSTECPISNAYSPTLEELMGQFRSKPVRWFGICV